MRVRYPGGLQVDLPIRICISEVSSGTGLDSDHSSPYVNLALDKGYFKVNGETTMELEHEGHHIHVIDLPTISGKRWKFSVVVCWESDGIRRIKTLSCLGRAFETAHHARLEGIAFTKKWIDEGKPALH